MPDKEMVTSSACQPDLRFGKAERLRHKRLVDRLFREGKSFYAYPLRVVYVVDSDRNMLENFKSRRGSEDADVSERMNRMRVASLQMMVSIPKRKMRHAVDRVWLRRRVREAWRLSRVPLREALTESGLAMSVGLMYVGSEKLGYKVISHRMSHIIAKLEAVVAAMKDKEEGE